MGRRSLLIATVFLLGQSAAGAGGSGDFDGDGRAELLMRHEHTGEWRYHGLADTGEAEAVTLPLPTETVYRLMGIGDFDGDGVDDVLFQRRDNLAWLYFALQPPDYSPRVLLREDFGLTRDPAVELRGVGDLDGDDRDDLVLRDTVSGEWTAHLMYGADSERRDVRGVTRNLRFLFEGLGDFNGDGREDLLLRHADQCRWISYEMGANLRGALQRPALTRNCTFALEGTPADLNGDGTDDLLLRSEETGEWIVYRMEGVRPMLRRARDVSRDAAYDLVAIDDFDGDGDASLLLRHERLGDWIEFDLAGATARAEHHSELARDLAWRGARREAPNTADGLWTTEDGRIVVELRPDEVTAANLFDLNGKTLVFTPDGENSWSREVREVVSQEVRETLDEFWIVGDGSEVTLPFTFQFGGSPWDTVQVRRTGLLVFGDTYTDPYRRARFDGMMAYVRSFRSANVVAALYKPLWRTIPGDATIHVANHGDRIVFTWSVTDWSFHVHGVAPDAPETFQTVLHADGRIAFHYRNVQIGDGIVGLFPHQKIEKADLLVSIADPGHDADIPGHLDLTGATIHEAAGRGIIVEFTTREAIPEPDDGEAYHYSVYFDFDEPYWEPGAFWEDVDFQWTIDLRGTGHHSARDGEILPRQQGTRIAMLGNLANVGATFGSVVADAVEFDRGGYVASDRLRPALVQLPSPPPPPDLLMPATGTAWKHSEAFHHLRMTEELANSQVAARLVSHLGDEFDFLVFHGESRVDVQEHGSPMNRFGANVGVQGIGLDGRIRPRYESSRVKGGYVVPVWVGSRMVSDQSRPTGHFDEGLVHVAHEFTHLWGARASYATATGIREPLFTGDCRCHWRRELHQPAAFPWREADAAARSSMGGVFWHENADGTFRMVWNHDNTLAGGPSWLDLYVMGLADAREVPDLLILRNAERVSGEHNTYTGTKEVVTVDQIVAAEGQRLPAFGEAQTAFNLAFVYLLEPGTKADPDLLTLHQAFRDEFVAYWAHVTGGRSEVTTLVPSPRKSQLVEKQPIRLRPTGRPEIIH